MYLHHGVLKENFESMKEHGIKSESFWGDEYEAIKYTDCNKLIRIEANKYTILPNLYIADTYEGTGCDPETVEEWKQSDKTWQDSLRIFGSVIVEERVYFDEDWDVIEGDE
jgi:hypothetical protein